MSIQQSINQGITTAGLLYTQTGQFKEREKQRALKGLSRDEEKATSAASAITKDKELLSLSQGERDLAAEQYRKLSEIAHNRFELDPTEKNKELAANAADVANLFEELQLGGITPNNLKVRSRAQIQAEKQRQARVEQKELFTKYMKENYSQWQNQS